MYESHFGLTETPFRIAPDLRFHVETAPQRAAIAAFSRALAAGEVFMTLGGAPGIGKTTVARWLQAEIDGERWQVAELGSLQLLDDEFLGGIAAAFGVVPPDPADVLPALVDFLMTCAHAGRDVLLVIDEAQRLDAAALDGLRRLAAVRTGERSVLHVLLVGQGDSPALADLKRSDPAFAALTARALPAFDLAETRLYLLHRLRLAGWRGDPTLGAAATSELHARTRGVPGRINLLFSRVLLHLLATGGHDASVAVIREVDALVRFELADDAYPGDEPPLAKALAASALPSDAEAPAPAPPPRWFAEAAPASAARPPMSMPVPAGRLMRRSGASTELVLRDDIETGWPLTIPSGEETRRVRRSRPLWVSVAAVVLVVGGAGAAWRVSPFGPAASGLETAGATPPRVDAGDEAARRAPGVPVVATAASVTAPPAGPDRVGPALAPRPGSPAPSIDSLALPAEPTRAGPPVAVLAAVVPLAASAAAAPAASGAGSAPAASAANERRQRWRARAAQATAELDAANAARSYAAPLAVPAAAAGCAANAEAMGLCRPASPHLRPAAPPADRAPGRGCDLTQAALGLCPGR